MKLDQDSFKDLDFSRLHADARTVDETTEP
jgi:hypothetical protein